VAEGEGEAGSPPNRETSAGLDLDLSQRQMLNRLSHPGAPVPVFLEIALWRGFVILSHLSFCDKS